MTTSEGGLGNMENRDRNIGILVKSLWRFLREWRALLGKVVKRFIRLPVDISELNLKCHLGAFGNLFTVCTPALIHSSR